jgi:DNA-binding MarR family transcriptional regulator
MVTADPAPRTVFESPNRHGQQKPGQRKPGQQNRGDQDTARPTVEPIHVDALMTIIHTLTGAGSNRPTNVLDVRQRLVVQTLGLHGAQPTASIGSRLGLSASTMTGIVDRLETLDLVVRQPHPSDRRIKLVQLTAQGDGTFEQERQFYSSILDATVSGLDTTSVAAVLDALAALSVIDQENNT